MKRAMVLASILAVLLLGPCPAQACPAFARPAAQAQEQQEKPARPDQESPAKPDAAQPEPGAAKEDKAHEPPPGEPGSTQSTAPPAAAAPAEGQSTSAQPGDAKTADSKTADPKATKPSVKSRTRRRIVRNGSTADSPVQISPRLSPEASSRQLQKATSLLVATEGNLKKIASRQLDPNQQQMADQVRRYMMQARAALDGGDSQRGYTLASKANLLSNELLKH